MTSHVIAYRSLELLFGTHRFHFNCFFEDFNCVFTQKRCLSRVLNEYQYETVYEILVLIPCAKASNKCLLMYHSLNFTIYWRIQHCLWKPKSV